jgi:hypothetical protein
VHRTLKTLAAPVPLRRPNSNPRVAPLPLKPLHRCEGHPELRVEVRKTSVPLVDVPVPRSTQEDSPELRCHTDPPRWARQHLRRASVDRAALDRFLVLRTSSWWNPHAQSSTQTRFRPPADELAVTTRRRQPSDLNPTDQISVAEVNTGQPVMSMSFLQKHP